MHTSVYDHNMIADWTLPNEPWIPIVCIGAGTDAVVAAGTSVRIDKHCLRSIQIPILREEFEHIVIYHISCRVGRVFLITRIWKSLNVIAFNLRFLVHIRQNVFFHYLSRDM